jgi:hypothetical protein
MTATHSFITLVTLDILLDILANRTSVMPPLKPGPALVSKVWQVWKL